MRCHPGIASIMKGTSMRRLLLLLSVLLLLASCGNDPAMEDADGDQDATDEEDVEGTGEEDATRADPFADDADPSAVADQPADAQPRFVTPTDGDVVMELFLVQMEATGVEIVPAGDPVPGQGHFHITVDAGCLEEGAVVPGPGEEAEADGYYHFGDGASEVEMELEPGTHELCLQLADGVHRVFGQAEVITVTVEAGRG